MAVHGLKVYLEWAAQITFGLERVHLCLMVYYGTVTEHDIFLSSLRFLWSQDAASIFFINLTVASILPLLCDRGKTIYRYISILQYLLL